MLDLIAIQGALRGMLVRDPGVAEYVGQRVWFGTVTPDSYDPTDQPGVAHTGPGILATLQAGIPNRTGVYVTARLTVQSITIDQITAWRLDSKIRQALEGRKEGQVRAIRTIQEGSQTTFPGQEWPVVMRMFELTLA